MSALLSAVLDSISRLLAIAAGILMLALVGLTVADVIGRSAFGQSILGTVDISTLLLVGIAFLGLAWAEIDGRHVAVTLLEARVPERLRTVFAVVRMVLLLVLGAVLLYGMWQMTGSALERGETTNGLLRLPTWPAKVAVTVSFALFFLAALRGELRFLRGDRPADPALEAGGDLAFRPDTPGGER